MEGTDTTAFLLIGANTGEGEMGTLGYL